MLKAQEERQGTTTLLSMWRSSVLMMAGAWLASVSCASGASAYSQPFPSFYSDYKFQNSEVLATFAEVNYDWDGSPWANRDEAIESGAFSPANNIITGINRFKDKTFLTVPRWKVNVPSTLNTLEFINSPIVPGHKVPVLRPWPDWYTNINVFKYVQSVFIDHGNDEMWVIDTGRRYFFSAGKTIDAPASLHIFSLSNKSIVKSFEFPNEIFNYSCSFLNDIVVDTVRQVAYMTDTNIDGRGAVVAYRRSDNSVIRFEDPSSTYANRSFVIEVDGHLYPDMNSPADGIALSGDTSRLFYSAVEGNTVFAINTTYLRSALDSPSTFDPSTLFDKVRPVFFRGTASDGMAWLPLAGYGGVAYGQFDTPTGVASFSDSDFFQTSTVSPANISDDAPAATGAYNGAAVNKTFITRSAAWVDTFAVVPWYTITNVCDNAYAQLCDASSPLYQKNVLPQPIPVPVANCENSERVVVPSSNDTVCPNLYSGQGWPYYNPASPSSGQLLGFSLYYTANHLQLFFNGSMDFKNQSLANMVIYRSNYFYAPEQQIVKPATEMKMAIAFLGTVGAISFVTIVILIVAKISRDREGLNRRGGDVMDGYVVLNDATTRKSLGRR